MADNTKFRPYKYIKELPNIERISQPAIRDQLQNSIMLGPSEQYEETILDNQNVGFFDLWSFCINHYRYSFFETARSEIIVVPDMMSCVAPFCNIVFPDEYLHYGREVKLRGLVTRYFEQGFFTTPSLSSPLAHNVNAEFAQEAFVAPTSDLQPTIIDVIKGECSPYKETEDSYVKFTQIPLPEELHYGATYLTGKGEYLSRMGEEYLRTGQGANANSNAAALPNEEVLVEEYNNFHKLNVMYRYFLTRLQSQKTTQVKLAFTPRLIPGLPVLLFSRTGRHILGLITSMSHTLDANGIAETHLNVEYQYLYDDVTKRPLYLLRSKDVDNKLSESAENDPYIWKNHFMLSDDFRDYKIGAELYSTILCDSIENADYNGFVFEHTSKLKDKSLLGIHEIIRNDFGAVKPKEEKKETEKPKTTYQDVGLEPVEKELPSSCLVAGRNFIKLETNENKLVELIRQFDRVQSYNVETGENEIKVIKEVKSHIVDSYYNINDKLFVTGEHPILTTTGWKKIKDLKITDILKREDGTEIVTRKRLIKKTVKVYNFEVDAEEGLNNYYANGYILHNKTMGFGNTKGKKNSGNWVGGYNFKNYAEYPGHIEAVRGFYRDILNIAGVDIETEISSVLLGVVRIKLNTYIKISESKGSASVLNFDMFKTAWEITGVDPFVLMAECQQDSQFGTTGAAVYTMNPGNVGTYGRPGTDGESKWYFRTWQDGINAVGYYLTGTRGYKNFKGLDLEKSIIKK